MEPVATQLFCLKLFAHRAHHDVQGPTFFSDHEELSDLYEAYDKAYDSAVERIIGLGGKLDIAKLNEKGAKMAAVEPNQHDPKVLFTVILNGERALCQLCTAGMTEATEGTKNLLAQLCDDSEQRQFLIQKRLTV